MTKERKHSGEKKQSHVNESQTGNRKQSNYSARDAAPGSTTRRPTDSSGPKKTD